MGKGVAIRHDDKWYEVMIGAEVAASAAWRVETRGCRAASWIADERNTILGPFTELDRTAAT